MIYKKEFLEKCLAYRFKYIYLSLHGGTAETHNKMSGAKDSFAQIKSFLEHLQTFSHELVLSFNCVVTKNNIDHLEAVIAFIKSFGFKKIKFSLLEPKGLGYENIDKLFVSPEKVAKEICILIEKYPDMNIAWDGLPLCLVK
jgi:MoaA/NifB/PqqE/SkfB family radical SAM enzyme